MTRAHVRFARAAVLALLVLVPDRAGAYDPELHWRTISTRRFDVHYHDGGYNLAVRVARIAEEVLDDVGALFGHLPESRIDVVLVDSSDGANGSATVTPKPTIRLLLAAPTELTGLSSYEDWLRILMIHELAHICDLDQAYGIPYLLSLVLGSYPKMNQYTPQFLSEGAGVWAETVLSRTGRGRSSYVAMLIRTAALDGKLVDIDQAHILYSEWPGGSAAYFYGGLFHLWLEARFGRDKVRALHQYYAATPFPYVYWPGAVSVFGKSLPELWSEWLEEETAFAKEIQGNVRALGETKSKRITFHGRNITGARYSPKGDYIVYSRSSPVDGPTMRRVGREGEDDRHLVLDTYSPRFAWTPEGDIVFSQSAVNERYWFFDDLFRYEVKTENHVRLRDADNPGKSLRARDPDVSPDGRYVVFVQNKLHQSWVSIGELTGKDKNRLKVRVLVPPSGDTQHASPRFSPDGKLVALSSWAGGKRDIIVVNAETGGLVRRLTFDDAEDGNPCWSPDGRFVLWESDADGISNIYAFELPTARYFRLTRVVGGAFQPDVSPDGKTLLFRNASGVGFDLHERPFSTDSFVAVRYEPEGGYVEGAVEGEIQADPDPLWAHAPLAAGLMRDDEFPIIRKDGELDNPYSPWATLLPFQDNWLLIPAIYFLNDDPGFVLLTSGSDVLGNHSYSAAIGSSWYTQRLNWSASYSNSMWYPSFGAGVGESHASFDTLRLGRVIERRRSIGMGVSLPIKGRHNMGLGYVWQRREGLTPRAGELLTLGDVSYTSIGYSYSHSRRFPYSVGAEHGRSLGLAARYYAKPLGSEFDELMLTFDARAYVNNPLFDNHVLGLKLTGALAVGPQFKERFILGGSGGSSLITAQTEQVYALRGFPLDLTQIPPGTGLIAAYAEYRLPIWQVERGLWTLPIYAERLHGALFADSGTTFGDGSEPGPRTMLRRAQSGVLHPNVSSGLELRADLSIGWAYPLTVRAGAAWRLFHLGEEAFVPAPLTYLSFGTAL